MKRKPKLAIFASGNGSNFSAIVEAVLAGELDCEIALLVCDQGQAFVLERSQKVGIPVLQLAPKDFPSREQYEQGILQELRQREVDWLVLAGYLRVVGQTLLSAYPKKIVNIHPSLLPAYPGLNSIQKAYEAKEKTTGVTLHYIDEGIDTGPIIAQVEVPILAEDSLASLTEKVHQVEHQLYPQVLKKIIAL